MWYNKSMVQNGFLKKAVFAILIVIFTLFVVLQTNAQTAQPSLPQFLVTWRALNSFVPPLYVGKVLPGARSRITASLELVSNGKLVNLKSQTIYWYLNDNLLGGGAGMQRITFSPYDGTAGTLVLRIELPDFGGKLLMHEVTIPVVRPVAVIYAPYPNDQFSGSQATVKALPYFFNASSSALAFEWSVNGVSVESKEGPDILHVNLPGDTPSNSKVNISLTMQNPGDSTMAIASKNLIYQK
jgi:hypothetical protein